MCGSTTSVGTERFLNMDETYNTVGLTSMLLKVLLEP